MRKTLLISMFLLAAGCVTTPTAEEPQYRQVAGWPGWMCADVVGTRASLWYHVEYGADTAEQWEGTCLDWQNNAPAIQADESEPDLDGSGADIIDAAQLTSYRVVTGWPTWRCADFKTERAESVWYLDDQGVETAGVWPGNCDSWAK